MIKGRMIVIYLAVKYQGDWEKILQAIKQREDIDYEKAEKVVRELPFQAITILDPEYPDSLKNIYRPPFVLFYYGDFSLLNGKRKNLAVIGSREASEYGKSMVKKILPTLCQTNINIISGLAKGIDVAAHQAALRSGGKTIAILGNGIDYCYPKENLSVYEEIKREHLLISEYPYDLRPSKQFFPWRNRLIAGLSEALFVVEAKSRSGTSLTINHALQQGKTIFVLPHRADEDNSTNKLIKDGAILVESSLDILDEIGALTEEKYFDEKIFI